MIKRLLAPIPASELGRRLGLGMSGPDREIRELCGLEALTGPGLAFMMDRRSVPPDGGTLIAAETEATDRLTVLKAQKPRLEFIRAQHLLRASPGYFEEAAPADIHPEAAIDPRAVIEAGVRVGAGTRVGALAVLKAGTAIGRDCSIHAGAVIGEEGFGFERDAQGHPIRMLHFGGVKIGDHVEIGSLTTVVRGALGDTVIEDHVKIDDHCHISHNCRVGEGAMITAGVVISGSVRIGRDVWLAPNCALVQKISVGEGAFVGVGAVVTRSVPAGVRVAGNPARPLPSIRRA